ncbi:hypothetical protein ACNKHW_03720 [Shigella flexneri]
MKHELDPKGVKRVVLCSGKVYYDLLEQRRKNNQTDVAIIRIDSCIRSRMSDAGILAPVRPCEGFCLVSGRAAQPGAWYCCQHNFREAIPAGASLRYAGRPASASPAVGYTSVHQQQQQELVNDALNVE